MNTANTKQVAWKDIDWKQVERYVFKLQKRIYRASQSGDRKLVHRLQKTLLRSWYARCLAVRKVTQDNQGKKTAGVDGIKALTPSQRLILAKNLKLTDKAKATRQVWIPKPGKTEKRPLGIPTMEDRAKQALAKQALEPEWEAKFEANSYGFRPGRSAHDAVAAIKDCLKQKEKYILDADIKQCFDRIDHQKLLAKVNTFPKMRRQIRAWLKSGTQDNHQWFPTEAGTPQGGVISPLLANIALHGLEDYLLSYVETKKIPTKYGTLARRDRRKALGFVRYADDFVIIHENLEVILKCKELTIEWLKDLGLELKEEKTQITHSLRKTPEFPVPGFNFLGFTILQRPCGKYRTKLGTRGRALGFELTLTPSKEAVTRHYQTISKIIDSSHGWSQERLIDKLNPIITGWANYYKPCDNSKAFSRLDNQLWGKLSRWSKRKSLGQKALTRGGKKVPFWVGKYWGHANGWTWAFTTGIKTLRQYRDFNKVKYVKVEHTRSPFDGDKGYWGSRMSKHPELSPLTVKLLHRQRGKCAYCSLSFKFGDIWEKDHIIPQSQGGERNINNLQLLHKHCHDSKTAQDGKREDEC